MFIKIGSKESLKTVHLYESISAVHENKKVSLSLTRAYFLEERKALMLLTIFETFLSLDNLYPSTILELFMVGVTIDNIHLFTSHKESNEKHLSIEPYSDKLIKYLYGKCSFKEFKSVYLPLLSPYMASTTNTEKDIN